MKTLLAATLILAALTSTSATADFVHPMDFDGSEQQKNEVIQYIKDRVRQSYCNSNLDMCQETILRMMEKQNLASFKNVTKAKNRQIMDRVIKDYCQGSLDMCDYTVIEMMYLQNLSASKESLTW